MTLLNRHTLKLVTPLVGVWIEIYTAHVESEKVFVTPLVGVWIEIEITDKIHELSGVTPLVGVWIEIIKNMFEGL